MKSAWRPGKRSRANEKATTLHDSTRPTIVSRAMNVELMLKRSRSARRITSPKLPHCGSAGQ